MEEAPAPSLRSWPPATFYRDQPVTNHIGAQFIHRADKQSRPRGSWRDLAVAFVGVLAGEVAMVDLPPRG